MRMRTIQNSMRLGSILVQASTLDDNRSLMLNQKLESVAHNTILIHPSELFCMKDMYELHASLSRFHVGSGFYNIIPVCASLQLLSHTERSGSVMKLSAVNTVFGRALALRTLLSINLNLLLFLSSLLSTWSLKPLHTDTAQTTILCICLIICFYIWAYNRFVSPSHW